MRRHFVHMKIKIQQISHTWQPLSIDLRICTALELCHQCCFYYTITCPPAHKKVITILNRHIKVIVMMLLNSSRRKYLIMKRSPPIEYWNWNISTTKSDSPRCLNPQSSAPSTKYLLPTKPEELSINDVFSFLQDTSREKLSDNSLWLTWNNKHILLFIWYLPFHLSIVQLICIALAEHSVLR